MSQDRITPEEYMAAQIQLLALANLVRDLPLARMLDAISLADTTGPMVDPTLWKAAHGKMDEIRRLASTMRRFQAEVEAILAENAAREARRSA